MSDDSTIEVITFFKTSNDAESLSNELRAQGCAIRYQNASSLEELESACDNKNFHIAIFSTAHGDACKQAVKQSRSQHPEIPVIVYTAEFSVEEQSEYLQLGADNYIPDADEYVLLWCVTKEKNNAVLQRKVKRLEEQYAENEVRIRTLMNSSRDAIAYIHEGTHVYCNEAYIEFFGFEDADTVEATPILNLIESADVDRFKKTLRDITNGEHLDEEMEFNVVKVDGENLNSIMEFSSASIEGEECTQLYIRNNMINEKELEAAKSRDHVTGLYNSDYFMARLDEVITGNVANPGQHTDFILYIDVDEFKKKSSDLGLVATNELIGNIGNFLTRFDSDQATIARFSADVYTIMLRGATAKLAATIAADICTGLKATPITAGGQNLECTCSIGVLQLTSSSTSAAQAVSKAESACKIAKSQGKNQHYMYTAEDERAKSASDQKSILLIKNGLKENLFCLKFQPIVSMSGETDIRYHAAFDYSEPNSKLPTLPELMDIANETGMVATIESWILKTILTKVAQHQILSRTKSEFFVPISCETANQAKLVTALMQAVSKAPVKFVFELSAKAIETDDGSLARFAVLAANHGCSMALSEIKVDTDIKSLLARYKARYIKVDRDITDKLSESKEAQQVLKTLQIMGKSLGLGIIATHIDEASAIANLWNFGIQLIQGNYIQPPDKNLSYDFAESA